MRSIRLYGLLLMFCALALVTPSQAAETPRIYALTHATAVTEPGTTVEDATIVLRNGLIESVQPGGAVPADAVEIDCTDRYVYAGFIDADSSLGRPAARRSSGGGGNGNPFAASTPETPKGAVHPLSLVRPEAELTDAVTPFEGELADSMESFRNLGFTVVHTTPERGVFRGAGATRLLIQDRPVAETLLTGRPLQHTGFDRARFGGGYPTSLMGTVATLRQVFLDAQRYRDWSERYAANPAGMERPARHAAFEALLPLLRGESRVMMHSSHPLDTLKAHEIAAQFEVDAILAVSAHEAEYAEAIAKTGRSLVVSVAFPDKPKVETENEALAVSMETMRRYLDAAQGPATLHNAGIRFALSSSGLENRSSFHKQMKKIVEAGLSEEVALAALTTVPAELLGIERSTGSITVGKIANLVVTDAPLFDEETQVRDVFVDGSRFELEIKEKPKVDPDAVVDPSGSWTVSMQFGPRKIEREWVLRKEGDGYAGTAEMRDETVDIESISMNGNEMTVVYPSRGGQPGLEIVVVIDGESFVGTTSMRGRSTDVEGKRTSKPEGGAR